jgi:lipopolysaccharide biosynthesis regulator YciM
MNPPRSRGRKLLLVGLSAVCLGLAGVLGYMMYTKNTKGGEKLEDAERDYAAGVEAYGKGEYAKAAESFDLAHLRAEKILQTLEKADDQTNVRTSSAELYGRTHYLRARAIRDSHYAKSQRDGKPINEIEDSTTNEKYRSFRAIPESKDRDTAIASLRGAAERLTKEPEVLKEALRVELTAGGFAWDRITTLCQQLLEINPNDGRALYWLANHEFRQRSLESGNWRELNPAKRAAARVEKALQYVRRAAQNKSPYWRTAYLETEILTWLDADATKKKGNTEYKAALRTLLLDPTNGAVARTANPEALNLPHPLDLEGFFGTQTAAVKFLARDARSSKAKEDELAELLTNLVDSAGKARNTPVGKRQASAITKNLLQCAQEGQVALARVPHPSWAKIFNACWDNANETESTNLDKPEIIDLLAKLNRDEVYFTRRRGNADEAAKIEKRFFNYLKDALEDAEKQKRPIALKETLHNVAMRTKFALGIRGEEITPHIEALKLATQPILQARAALFEGLLAVSQGRLGKARDSLEKALGNKDLKELHLEVRLELIQVLLALGECEPAFNHLREVEPDLERPDELAPAQLAWRDGMLQNLDNFRALMVVAQLDTALGRAVRHVRDHPGQPLPTDLAASYEKGAESYLIRLKAGTPADQMARTAWFNYWIRLGRREAASAALKELESRFPHALPVLEARVRFALLPPEKAVGPVGIANRETRDKADQLILDYIAKHPTERDPKLFWARWLLQTSRNDEAVAYLEDKKNFEDQKDAAVARALAQALLRQGKPEAASRLLDAFPADPSIDIALIEAAANRADQEKQLQDALKRFENNALIRLYEASVRLNDQKYEEAVEGYLHATEFQQVRMAAQAGLLRAVSAYASEKPGAARELIVRLMKDYPREPILAIGAAVAAFGLDDIGNPGSDWGSSRSMGAALRLWEQLADASIPRPALGMIKAQFWYQAGKPDWARQEAQRGMGREGTHLPSVNFLLGLAIEARNAEQIKQLKGWLTDARKKNPKNNYLAILDARIREYEGPVDAVVAFYQSEIAAEPKESSFYDRLVAYLLFEGKNAEALDWSRKWREALPENDVARLAIVQSLAVLGDVSSAKKAAEEFVQIRSEKRRKQLAEMKPPPPNSLAAKEWPKRQKELQDDAERSAQLEIAAMFFRAKRWTEAEEYSQATLKSKDDYVPGLLMLGDAALSKKQYKEACKYYQAILEKAPRHLIAANNLAFMLSENLNQPDEAMKVIEKFRKDATGDKPISTDRLPAAMLDTLGVVYLKLKQPAKLQEMKQVFEGAVQRFPRDPRMHLYLGQACLELNLKNQALQSLRSAEKIVSTEGFKELTESETETVRVALKDALKRVGN